MAETIIQGPARDQGGSVLTNPDSIGESIPEFAGLACLVYQPGGGRTGPVVFDDWTALMARLDALRVDANDGGCFDIRFDDTFTTPASIPPGFYDMRNTTWRGRDNAGGNFVEMSDGTVFLGLRNFDRVIVTNLNTVVSPCGDIGSEDNSIVTLTGGAVLQSAPGTVPIFDVTNLVAVICLLREGSFLGLSDQGPVFQLNVAGSFLFVQLEGISGFNEFVLHDTSAGAFLLVATSTMQTIVTVVANWTGTVLNPRLDDPASVLPNPYLGLPSGGVLFPTPSQWLRYNPPGGGIAQTLPSISGAFNTQSSPGEFLIVSNYSGANNVDLSPGAGDTINGGAGPLSVGPRENIILISDGVSDWRAIASYP